MIGPDMKEWVEEVADGLKEKLEEVAAGSGNIVDKLEKLDHLADQVHDLRGGDGGGDEGSILWLGTTIKDGLNKVEDGLHGLAKSMDRVALAIERAAYKGR